MTSNNWESDDLNLKNELKLIDDSFYRVYDDNDYEIWKERMLSIIVIYEVIFYAVIVNR